MQKRGGPVSRAGDRADASATKGRSLLDQRYSEIELQPFLLTRQRKTNRVEQRLSFGAGLLANPRCDCAEQLLADQRTGA